jgi:hypothetical protein
MSCARRAARARFSAVSGVMPLANIEPKPTSRVERYTPPSKDGPGLENLGRRGEGRRPGLTGARGRIRETKRETERETPHQGLSSGTYRLSADDASRLDLHHNFVARETHAGDVLLVHRKGAIRATRETLALIPGSMGTASYLVRGLGHPASFESASHGAGRVMTRREARTRVPRAKLVRHLRHVVFDVDRAESLVEEAPSVYRPIREVLEDEADLVEPVLRLEPLVVLKG